MTEKRLLFNHLTLFPFNRFSLKVYAKSKKGPEKTHLGNFLGKILRDAHTLRCEANNDSLIQATSFGIIKPAIIS